MGVLLAIVGLATLLAEPSDRIERLGRWADSVAEHRPGESDAALQRVAAMSIADVQTLSSDAQTLITLMRRPGAMVFFTTGSRKEQVQINYSVAELGALRTLARRATVRDVWCGVPSDKCANDFVKRAALLEQDVAMLRMGERAPIGRTAGVFGFEVKVSDGEMLSVSQAPVHWAMARRMIDLVTPYPNRDPMVRAWYVATIAQLEAEEQHDTDHHERGLALFPDDAALLFFNGCLHEIYASDRTQAAVKVMRLPAGLSVAVRSAHSELLFAEEYLRKAVAADPEAAEARLHLGRVLGLLGHHQEAHAELQRAAEKVGESANQYDAAMFLGLELEALSRGDEAQAAYLRARSLYPGAPSPLLALSQLAWRRGDRPGALTLVLDAFGTSGEDPWWTYDLVHARRAEALLEEMRRPFLEDRQR